MANVAVVTDSMATIPVDLVRKYNISVAPLHIIWDKIDYRDGVDIQTGEFYSRLPKSKTLPTTDSAIQGEFLQIFESLKATASGIVVLTVSAAMPSGCYDSALSAKALVEGIPIEVIDTRTALMAQGFSVLAAAKVAASGGDILEVCRAGSAVAPKTHTFWAMDTLEYFRRLGRLSLPRATLASWLKVKPILGVVEGKLAALDRVRTKAKVIDKLLEIMGERLAGNSPLHVSVLHGNSPQEAEQLEQEVITRYNPAEVLRSEITPVIGTYTGPGTLGLAFYNE